MPEFERHTLSFQPMKKEATIIIAVENVFASGLADAIAGPEY
jgi:hypothetical protein